MTKEQLIKTIEKEIPIEIVKCRKQKIKIIQFYKLGKLYSKNELYRRLTGKQFDISKAYFNN